MEYVSNISVYFTEFAGVCFFLLLIFTRKDLSFAAVLIVPIIFS